IPTICSPSQTRIQPTRAWRIRSTAAATVSVGLIRNGAGKASRETLSILRVFARSIIESRQMRRARQEEEIFLCSHRDWTNTYFRIPSVLLFQTPILQTLFLSCLPLPSALAWIAHLSINTT